MKLARFLLPAFVALAVLAGVIAIAAGSSKVTVDDGSSAISSANSNFTVNGATSDNVYQQQVVGLWGIKDMVEATAKQNVTIIDTQAELLKSQNSIASLTRGVLIVLVLLMGLLGVLGGIWLKSQRPEASPFRVTEVVSEEPATEA